MVGTPGPVPRPVRASHSASLPPSVSQPASQPAPLPLPLPRRPLDASDQVRLWYENELGWPTVPADPAGAHEAGVPGSRGGTAGRRGSGGRGGPESARVPLRLRTGVRFDVLDLPAEAGRAALRHLAPDSPVAVRGDRMRLLVAAGSAEELPGVLAWLEWGALPLDLTALGEGGLMDAPAPPATGRAGGLSLSPGGAEVLQGAATWLRPPGPGREVEASLPTLSALGGGGGAPDLVRVVATAATRCHRLRLMRASAQPLAFS
ncbi:SCO3374 family protein [Streptomyces sp. NPDC005574]|uniref:SCO3374 family protein n=1 Tax=Streptomyces sp. NPDC005574 TaxID=3156891 RepID=UPI0033A34907